MAASAQFQPHMHLWNFSRYLHRHGWRRLARAVKGLNFYLHHCLLPPEVCLGEGLVLDHYAHGVVLHPNVVIGSHVRIYHDVTIAAENAIGSEFQIYIGDHVVIGAGAKVIGKAGRSLRIGDHSTIGAGAVVTCDVPAREVWAGVPARRLSSPRKACSIGLPDSEIGG